MIEATERDRVTVRFNLQHQLNEIAQLQCLPEDERTALQRLAARAWKLAELGLADIVQRRHGYEDYAYILVARRRPRRYASSILPLLLAEAA